MKRWEDMNPHERMEATVRDLKRRQEEREKGEKEAKAFIIERAMRQSRISQKAKNRGCRGCR